MEHVLPNLPVALHRPRLAALALLAISLPGAGAQIRVEANAIDRIAAHRVAYDPVLDALLAIGGFPGDHPAPAATLPHVLDRTTGEWNPLPAGTRPAPIAQFALATDPRRNRIVLFGGTLSAPFVGTDQTWEWDGTTWTRRVLPVAPPPRCAPAMAFDERRNVMVLFGGFRSLAPGDWFRDTWEYDGIAWTQRTTGNPPHNGVGRMAFDRNRGVSVFRTVDSTWEWDGTRWIGPIDQSLFGIAAPLLTDPTAGGVVTIGQLGTIEAWSGTAWSQVPTNGTPGLVAVAVDPATGFGITGYDGWGKTWWFRAPDWIESRPGTLPPDLRDARCVHDPLRNRALLVGPDGVVFARDSTARRWTPLHPTPAFPTRSLPAIAYDPARDELVLHGGRTNVQVRETWTFDPSTNAWSLRAPAHPGPQTTNGTMAYDPARQRLVLHGGSPHLIGVLSEWDGVDWTTVRYTTGPSSARSHQGMAWDPARRVLVAFGGDGYLDPQDTWEWDGASWMLRDAGNPLLLRLTRLTGAFDVARRRILAIGTDLDSVPTGLVEWDGETGTWHAVATRGDALSEYRDLSMAHLPETGETLVIARGRRELSLTSVFPATFTAIGAGCAGSHGVAPTLATEPIRPAWIGDRLELTIEDLAPAVTMSAVLFGASDSQWAGSALPRDLGFAGMPGCPLRVAPEVALPWPTTNGTARGSFAVPADPALVGSTAFVQGLALDPGANAAGVVLSSAGALLVGSR